MKKKSTHGGFKTISFFFLPSWNAIVKLENIRWIINIKIRTIRFRKMCKILFINKIVLERWTIGFFILWGEIFLSLVKLPRVIKIHSETTRPYSVLKIQVRSGIVIMVVHLFIMDQRFFGCDHSPHEVLFSFFFFLFSNPFCVIRWFVIIICFLLVDHGTSCTGVPFKSNPSRTCLKNYDVMHNYFDARSLHE